MVVSWVSTVSTKYSEVTNADRTLTASTKKNTRKKSRLIHVLVFTLVA